MIKPELKATFKFRIRGVAELPRKRHGAKTSILSMARNETRRLCRSLIELDRSGNLYQLASKFHGHRYPAIKSIKKDLHPRYHKTRGRTFSIFPAYREHREPRHTCANRYATSLRHFASSYVLSRGSPVEEDTFA